MASQHDRAVGTLTAASVVSWALVATHAREQAHAVAVVEGVPRSETRADVIAVLAGLLERYRPVVGDRLSVRRLRGASEDAALVRGAPRFTYEALGRPERRVNLRMPRAVYEVVVRAARASGEGVRRGDPSGAGSLQAWAIARLERAARAELDRVASTKKVARRGR